MLIKPGYEFDYLLASCLGGDTSPPTTDLQPFDWDLLRALSARHRVDGLLWQRLAAPGAPGAPAEILAALDRSRRAQSFTYLAQLSETLRLSNLLEAKGYPLILLKGCAVGQELYAPHPELRHSQDIDLLVDPRDFAAAGDILLSEGYVRCTPAGNMPQSADSMARYFTNAFEHMQPERGLKVELHHRPLADPYLMQAPFEELLARSTSREIGEGRMRCLGPTDLSVYLCCHAAGHAFFRLKWLADIARLLERAGEDGVGMMLSHARTLRCERLVLLTLVMLEQLAGWTASPIEKGQRRAIFRLAAVARKAMLRQERDQRFRLVDIPDRLRDMVYDVRLGPTWRSRMFKVLQHLCNLEDLSTLKLGVEWRMLYALLGRPLALRRLLRRSFMARGNDLA